MSSIQQDDTDIVARELMPKLIKLIEGVKGELTISQ